MLPFQKFRADLNLRVEKWRSRVRTLIMLDKMDRQANVSIAEVHGFNADARNAWVAERAKSVDSGSSVLDVGAGTAPYRDLFAHCRYETQDFSQYQGYQGPEGQYAQIDFVSDIVNIQAPDASFDVVLCTEVLEHVPRPIDALKEMVRITKPGGRLFLSAPLGSGLHQEPFHFYGGYTDHWYRKFLAEFGCEIISLQPNHGFFAHLAQECARVSWTFEQHKTEHAGYGEELTLLLGEILPRYFYELDKKVPIREFTVGFFVEARRLPIPS